MRSAGGLAWRLPSVAGAKRAGWEPLVPAGRLSRALGASLLSQSLRVGWLDSLTAWRLRAPKEDVPGESRRSYIAF